MLHDADKLDHQLVRYVDAGVQHTLDSTHLSYMADKGDIAGARLMPACFATPANIGIFACPTVSIIQSIV